MSTNPSQQKDIIAEMALVEFGLDLSVKQVVAWNMPLSRSAQATIFFNHKMQLFVMINTPSRQTLGDVQKLLYKIGVVAHKYLPPANRPNYFTEVASEYFHKTYPNRKINSDDDLRYFKTLALYNPALVQVSSVKQGVINCFDPDARGDWRVLTKLSYSRLGDF